MNDCKLCEDSVLEILLRCPVKSLFRFKSVSKSWNMLLHHPSFHIMYKSRQKQDSKPLLCFFRSMTRGYTITTSHPKISYIEICKQGNNINFPSFISSLGFVMESSNGLILCGYHLDSYYIITKQSFLLPLPNMVHTFCGGTAFAYEEFTDAKNGSISHRYTVILLNFYDSYYGPNYFIPAQTYSSHTGLWRTSTLRAAANFLLWPRRSSVFLSGIFYWFADKYYTVGYDPNNTDDKLWLISFPVHNSKDVSVLGESKDEHLQYCFIDTVGFRIYVLTQKIQCYRYSAIIEANEWIEVYVIRYPYCTPRNQLGQELVLHYSRPIAYRPLNSRFMYFKSGQEIFVFDEKESSTQLVAYSDLIFSDNLFDMIPYLQPIWPPSLP